MWLSFIYVNLNKFMLALLCFNYFNLSWTIYYLTLFVSIFFYLQLLTHPVYFICFIFSYALARPIYFISSFALILITLFILCLVSYYSCLFYLFNLFLSVYFIVLCVWWKCHKYDDGQKVLGISNEVFKYVNI